MASQERQSTVRLSLGGVLLLAIAVFGIGLAGGWVSTHLWAMPVSPLPDGQDRLVTTVQQVTVSPNTALKDLVSQHERAVVLIGQGKGKSFVPVGPGVVVTNDGLVVSVFDMAGDSLTALDDAGREIDLHKSGVDPLYGLVYYQLTNSVIQPFSISDAVASPGTSLLALSRDAETLQPSAASWQVGTYTLPTAGSASGRQRLFETLAPSVEVLSGTPLLDDNGSLAGMVLGSDAHVALTSADIRASLDRISSQKREYMPFTSWGMQVGYGFEFTQAQSQHVFTATVTAVTPLSPAAIAGVKVGDVITTINTTPVTWETNIAQQMSVTGPLTIHIARQKQMIDLTLNPS